MEIVARIVSRGDVRVEIGFDDFMEQAFDKDGEASNLEKINGIGGLLRRIPDKAIEAMTEGQRGIVAKFLRSQADRFEAMPAPQPGAGSEGGEG